MEESPETLGGERESFIYCGIIVLVFCGGSIFVEFVRTSYQGINILHKLRNQSINIFNLIHKILFFCKYKKYTKLRPHEPMLFQQSMKIGPHEF